MSDATGDELILVSPDDEVLGYLDKEHCHDGDGRLHRAFSIFLFDGSGRLLLQQRSPEKRLWAGFWSNSVCSHPRRDESLERATLRRLREELGIECDLRFLFRFEYRARDGERGTEHELCSVFAGRLTASQVAAIIPASTEIAALRWVALDQLDRDLAERPELHTPWFRLEWARLRAEHSTEIAELAG